jgi:hypothetical protein
MGIVKWVDFFLSFFLALLSYDTSIFVTRRALSLEPRRPETQIAILNSTHPTSYRGTMLSMTISCSPKTNPFTPVNAFRNETFLVLVSINISTVHITAHFPPVFPSLPPNRLTLRIPLCVLTSVHPALLAPSPHFSFFPLLPSSFFILALHPLFFASLIFFAALLSALLCCLPNVMGFWPIQGLGSPVEFMLWIVSKR